MVKTKHVQPQKALWVLLEMYAFRHKRTAVGKNDKKTKLNSLKKRCLDLAKTSQREYGMRMFEIKCER